MFIVCQNAFCHFVNKVLLLLLLQGRKDLVDVTGTETRPSLLAWHAHWLATGSMILWAFISSASWLICSRCLNGCFLRGCRIGWWEPVSILYLTKLVFPMSYSPREILYYKIAQSLCVCPLSPPKRLDVRRRNLACRREMTMGRTSAGSHIDWGHRWEES